MKFGSRHIPSTWSPLLAILLFACRPTAPDPVSVTEGPPPHAPCPLLTAVDDSWATHARVAAVALDLGMGDREVRDRLAGLRTANASVALFTGLFERFLQPDGFTRAARFLNRAVCTAHGLGLRVAVRFPTLEVVGPLHPPLSGVQTGMNGRPNVNRGEDRDSLVAWMCPNGPYRHVVRSRAIRLADTGVDALWLDPPLFLGDGAPWPCTCRHCSEAFSRWSRQRGISGPDLTVSPREADINSPVFRSWVHWRHVTLADFVSDLVRGLHAVHPDTWVWLQDPVMDHLDATEHGLDGTFIVPADRFGRVWETDSVSSTHGMRWASPEDFTSRIATLKFGRASDGPNPSLAFVNGFHPPEGDLGMGAILATGMSPFDGRTTSLTEGAGGEFRRRWFLAGAARPDLLPGGRRLARVGLLHSSPTRDYVDYAEALGRRGAFVTAEPPVEDPTWWTGDPSDSCALVPHLGEWRGAAHTLVQLGIPFRPVLTSTVSESDLSGLDVVWLPGVRALSDNHIRGLIRYVEDGGVLLATGDFPGDLDEVGGHRDINPMGSLFGVEDGEETPGDRIRHSGRGLAIYRSESLGRHTYESLSEADVSNAAWKAIERILRVHVHEDWFIKGPRWVHMEVTRESDHRHVLYVVNFSGLQQPLQDAPSDMEIVYRAPEGFRAVSVSGIRLDGTGQPPRLTDGGDGTWIIRTRVRTFGLFELLLEPDRDTVDQSEYGPPEFADPLREAAARGGLRFVLERLRDDSADYPSNQGIRSRARGDTTVTSETMGLLMRAAACLDEPRVWDDAFAYVERDMMSVAWHVPRRAMHGVSGLPRMEQDFEGGDWHESNWPVDDFRLVRGFVEGHRRFDRREGLDLAREMLGGLYWTSVAGREDLGFDAFPGYPGGLMGRSWKWEGTDDPTRLPPARASGLGETDLEMIPLEHQDLSAMGHGATVDPRWRDLLESATDFLLDAEIDEAGPPIGLFWNGLEGLEGSWSGDHASRDTIHGRHLNTSQVIRTALHLARAATLDGKVLDDKRRTMALGAASRTLRFLKIFFEAECRIPEYLTIWGTDVPNCLTDALPDCLYPGIDNRYGGDVRIYALAARLALELGDTTFAHALIERHILPDRIQDPSDPFYGQFGVSSTPPCDADARAVLEAVLTLCLEARAGH